jgi:hypothetical protein
MTHCFSDNKEIIERIDLLEERLKVWLCNCELQYSVHNCPIHGQFGRMMLENMERKWKEKEDEHG